MYDLLEILDRPQLNRPVLIAGFAGWANAGGVAVAAVEHLLGSPKPSPCARVNADSCYDQTVSRPLSSRDEAGGWKLTYPSIAVFPVIHALSGRDLLIVVGPEPSFHWQKLASELAGFGAELGATLGITSGSFVGAVSHRKPQLSSRVLESAIQTRLATMGINDTNYEGPTAFQTAMLHALDEAGVPAASLWVATPPYVQGANPRATLGILEALGQLGGLDLELGALRTRAAEWSAQLDRILKSNPTLMEQLGRLIEVDDLESPESHTNEPPQEVTDSELPSGESLIEELEQYLRNQKPDSE